MIKLPAALSAAQKIPASWLNAVTLAAAELQQATIFQPWVDLSMTSVVLAADNAWCPLPGFTLTASAGTSLVATRYGVLVTVAGRYQCTASMNWADSGTAGLPRYMSIVANRIDLPTPIAELSAVQSCQLQPVTAFMVARELTAKAGDTIDVWVFVKPEVGVPNTQINTARLSVRKVG